MEIDAYIRVSRVGGREGESFISPEVQREQIQRWADATQIDIAQWHTDLDQSGGKLNRPAFDAAMERIRRGQTDGIVVAKLDRFARSLSGALKAIEEIDQAGGKLVSVAEGLDPSTTMGKAMMRIILVLAELELDRIKENWTAARENAQQRGVHLSAPPFGYRKIKRGALEVDPGAAPYVQEIFRMRANRASWGFIINYLEANGVKTPRGNEHWQASAIKWLIQNQTYLGSRHHPALVSRREFSAANRVKGVAPKRTGASTGLLSGILRCAGCRYAMKAVQRRDGIEYRCKTKHHGTSSTCKAPATILANVIEPYVMDFVTEAIGDAKVEIMSGSDVAEAQAVVDAATAELDTFQTASEGLDREYLAEGLRQRIDAVKEAEAALQHALSMSAVPADLDEDWTSRPLEDQRDILRAVLDAVFVKRMGMSTAPVEERAAIYPVGSFNGDLPTKGSRWIAKPLAWPKRARSA